MTGGGSCSSSSGMSLGGGDAIEERGEDTFEGISGGGSDGEAGDEPGGEAPLEFVELRLPGVTFPFPFFLGAIYCLVLACC